MFLYAWMLLIQDFKYTEISIMAEEIIQQKILLVGKADVGKTALLYQYIKSVCLTEDEKNIDIQYQEKTIYSSNLVIKQLIWKTDKILEVANTVDPFYKTMDAIIIVLDTTKQEAFNNIQQYIHKVKNLTSPMCHIFLKHANFIQDF